MSLPAIRIEDLPDEFFIDLAVGTNPFLEICDNYGIDSQVAETLDKNPLFSRRLRIAQQVVEDDGTAFRARCRTIVTNNVHHIAHMMNDMDVPASTQLDAFKTLVKYGGLEPQKDENAIAQGPQLVLNIVAPDGSTMSFGAQNSQNMSHNDPIEADFEEITLDEAPELTILPPSASSLFGAS